MRTPLELGFQEQQEAFLEAVQDDPVYQRLFRQAFPEAADPFTLQNIAKAIAAFERTIISFRSPYDRYQWGGDAAALSASAKRGELLFFFSERGGCFQCHSGWNFSAVRWDGSRSADSRANFFHTGVSEYAAPNCGLFEHTREPEDVGKFRAPTLRNIALTAPYMHDGSLASLEEVIEQYAVGGRTSHPNKSGLLRSFSLTPDEKRDLIEFLKFLTDEELPHDPRWSNPWTDAHQSALDH